MKTIRLSLIADILLSSNFIVRGLGLLGTAHTLTA